MSEKFSQFSTESDLSQITGVAGYITGSPGTNVRISGADIDSSILRPGSGDVDINPTSGKIQLKQPNLQYNGTGSQTNQTYNTTELVAKLTSEVATYLIFII